MSFVILQRLVAAVFLAAFVGCDSESGKERSSGQSSESAGGGSYLQVTEAFAKALDAEDYPAAYALTSSHIRGKITAQQFAKFHSDARAEYGKPMKYKVSVGNDDIEEIRGEDWDDTGIPAKERLVWMHILWALEVDDAGDIDRGYETWMMIVKEDGENKVGSMEYTWPD